MYIHEGILIHSQELLFCNSCWEERIRAKIEAERRREKEEQVIMIVDCLDVFGSLGAFQLSYNRWRAALELNHWFPANAYLLFALRGKDKGRSPKKKGKGGRGVKSIGFAWICSIDDVHLAL